MGRIDNDFIKKIQKEALRKIEKRMFKTFTDEEKLVKRRNVLVRIINEILMKKMKVQPDRFCDDSFYGNCYNCGRDKRLVNVGDLFLCSRCRKLKKLQGVKL